MIADQGVRTMLELTHGIALGVTVGDLLQFQCNLAGNGVVNAATEVKKSLRLPVLLREFPGSRIPGWYRALDRLRQFQEPFQVRSNHLTGHAPLFTRQEQSK